MPRKRTRPLPSPRDAKQKELRATSKAFKGRNANIPGLCYLLIEMMGNRPKLIAAGDIAGADKMLRDMERAKMRLDEEIASNAQ